MADPKTTKFKAGAEAARHRICAWLRAQANAEYKLRPDGAARAAFVEAHNVILKMDLPEDVAGLRAVDPASE